MNKGEYMATAIVLSALLSVSAFFLHSASKWQNQREAEVTYGIVLFQGCMSGKNYEGCGYLLDKTLEKIK